MNLSHRAKHFPQQLSGGQQQRVAIARAVVTNPKLILADEPTGNLDSKNGAEVMNLLTELNKEGTSIVMVTHSQHDAGFAHRVIHLFDGSVEQQETPDGRDVNPSLYELLTPFVDNKDFQGGHSGHSEQVQTAYA